LTIEVPTVVEDVIGGDPSTAAALVTAAPTAVGRA
jgi:hypothetical protein